MSDCHSWLCDVMYIFYLSLGFLINNEAHDPEVFRRCLLNSKVILSISGKTPASLPSIFLDFFVFLRIC